jgi:hypothetical protein
MKMAVDYSIQYVTKESVEYREGRVAHEFFLGPTVQVPRSEDWDRVMPEPFRGRRDEIVGRLKANRLLASTPFQDVFA